MRRPHALILLVAVASGLWLRIAWLDARLAERPTGKSWRLKAAVKPPYDRVKWTHDEWMYYLSTAVNAFEGRGFVPDYNTVGDGVFVPPPGESLLLLGLFGLAGRQLEPRLLLLQQIVVAAVLLPLLWYGIGRRLASPATGLLLGFAVGLHPDAIHWSGYLLTESNYLVAFSLVLYLLLRYIDAPRTGLAAAAGLALGCSHLLRPNAVLLGPLLAVALLAWQGRKRRADALWLLALPLALMVPWLVRNLLVYREPILLSSNVGIHLYLANNPGLNLAKTPCMEQVLFEKSSFIPELEKKYRKVKGRLRVTYYEYSNAYGAALRAYVFERPLQFARNYLLKLASLFVLSPGNPRGATPLFRDSAAAYRWLHLVTVGAGLLGVPALLVWRRTPQAGLVVLVLGYLAATGALSMPSNDGRYGLLLKPVLLALGCAGAEVALRRLSRRGIEGPLDAAEATAGPQGPQPT